MKYKFNEEQLSLRALVASFAARTFSDEQVREHLDSPAGFDPAVWRALGSDLGVLGLALPTELGGEDVGVVGLALVAEELGRVLAGVPLLGSVALAGTVLAQCEEQEAQDAARRLVSGGAVVSLLGTDARGHWAPEGTDVVAETGASGVRVSGVASHVLDATAADQIVVVAKTDNGRGLFLVDSDAEGLEVQPQSVLDQTRRLGRVVLVRATATPLHTDWPALEAVQRARDVAAVVLAAEAVGASERLTAMSVEYASTRLQFGRPIGSFQGVKHRCADMHILAEQARSTAYHAAWVLDSPDLDDPRVAVDLATAQTAAAYQAVVKDALQVHGGIGFTWEHPIHLYYKRAVSDASLVGGRADAVERLGVSILDTARDDGWSRNEQRLRSDT